MAWKIRLALAGALVAVAAPAHAAEPQPPAPPAEIVAYRDSGEWRRDTVRVVDRARRVLARNLHPGAGVRPAIVLDVDDTSLSSYRCLKRAGFDRHALTGCATSAAMPAIGRTLALYRYARAHHVRVFFITGRREALRGATVANLRGAGYRGKLRLVMRPDHEAPGQHAGYKVRSRRSIERRGNRIVVNLGDQRSDLRGGHALRGLKLPNPMYVIR